MDRNLLKAAGQRLEEWQRTMILTHERPDGDALGAMVAMRRVIESSGRRAAMFVYDEIPARYAFLKTFGAFDRWPVVDPGALDGQFDGILILDTSSWSQLEPVAAYLRASSRPRIVVDHHATYDDLAGQGAEAVPLRDSTAASTCGLVHEWCEVMNWPIDPPAGEALLVGLTTDTGWFRFSNTDSRTLRSAADLIGKGIRPEVLYSRLYESWSPARLRLKALMLGSLQFDAGDAVAVMSLTQEMFRQAGATSADSEELVNEPMTAASVVVTVLLIALDDGRVRVNLRSKSPEVCGRDVDVSAIARSFGGGGHCRAAGVRMAGTLNEVRDRVVNAITKSLAATKPR